METSDQVAIAAKISAAIWIWDPDRRRIIWADDAGLAFWGEESLVDLVERDFAPFDEAVHDFGELIRAVLTRKSGKVRARMILAPHGLPVRVDCRAQRIDLSDGRPGLRIEAVPAPVGEEAEIDRLREIIDRIPTALSLFAEDGTLLMQNPAAEHSFGPELQNLSRRFGSRTTTRDALRFLLVNGSYSQAVELHTRVGVRRHRVTMRRMHDPMTADLSAIAFFTDIDDRAETAFATGNITALQDMEHLSIQEETEESAIVFDDAFKVLHLGVSANAILQNTAPERRSNIATLFPGNRKVIAGALTRMRDGQLDHADLRLTLYDPGGHKHPVQMSVRRGEWHKAAAWIGTLASEAAVTPPLSVQPPISNSNTPPDRALQALGVGVVTLTRDGLVEALDPAAATLFGAESNTLTGKPFDTDLDDTSAQAFRNALSLAEQNTDPQPFLMERKSEHDKSVQTFRAAITALNQDQTSPLTLTFTEVKYGSSDSGSGRSEAIARASHELRTPLNAIIGFTQVMLHDPDTIRSDTYRDYLKDIHDSGQYMARLVQDMLDMRRIEASALSLDFAPVNLGNLIQRIARELEGIAKSRDVMITISVEKSLPVLAADAHTLRQALTNLIGNAVKFTTDAVNVSAVKHSSGAVRIDVTDNGVGMTPDEIEHALQPYGQGRGSSSKFGGAGMGLPLAKGFIEANGGTFEIVSRKNEGTNVRIIFLLNNLSN